MGILKILFVFIHSINMYLEPNIMSGVVVSTEDTRMN